MANFDHENIVKLIGICLDNDPNFLILELMEGGDLLTYLRNCRPTTARQCSPLSLGDLVDMCLDVAKVKYVFYQEKYTFCVMIKLIRIIY